MWAPVLHSAALCSLSLKLKNNFDSGKISRLIAALVLRVLCLGLLVGASGGAVRPSSREVARPPMLLWGRLLPYREMEAGEGEIRHGSSKRDSSSSPLSTSERMRGSSTLGTDSISKIYRQSSTIFRTVGLTDWLSGISGNLKHWWLILWWSGMLCSALVPLGAWSSHLQTLVSVQSVSCPARLYSPLSHRTSRKPTKLSLGGDWRYAGEGTDWGRINPPSLLWNIRIIAVSVSSHLTSHQHCLSHN